MSSTKHPWQRACPRWYEWSMDVREPWKAWLGFGIPMFVLTTCVLSVVVFTFVWLAYRIAS